MAILGKGNLEADSASEANEIADKLAMTAFVPKQPIFKRLVTTQRGMADALQDTL